MKKTDIAEFIKLLKKQNSPQSEFVKFTEKHGNPFWVLITCILSLRTNDKTTYGATLRMLELGKTPEDFAKINCENLEAAIYPVGFYKNKAKQIIELSKRIVKEYKGKTPDTIEELIKFNGVGRKTANLVLAKGFNKPAICVDVHVHRICNRWGYVKTKTPDETEMKLREILPENFWRDFNTLLVTHGQNICKPTRPNCENCLLKNLCNFCK